MRVLAVDVGTGTQDILLYDSHLDIENSFKLVLPAPTMMIFRQIQKATQARRAVLLTGFMMGGGPSAWAAEAHAKEKLPIYATPDAARSFNDDLSKVEESGIRVISEDEAASLPDDVQRLELRDFNFQAIAIVFDSFGVPMRSLDAVSVAVFDHGAAPPDVSDRQFRFDYLDQRIRAENSLTAFAYRAEDIPPIMTRLQSVASTAKGLDAPLIVMDTAPAAVLGATFDPEAARLPRKLVANVGNFHTLAFRLGPSGIEGVFEHHTGLLDLPRLENYLSMLADGSLTHEAVFDDHGHGALIYLPTPLPLREPDGSLIVTGPRRSMMVSSRLRPYFAVPFGDMMIAGCFGLLAAVAARLPNLHEQIEASLRGAGGSGTPPWESG